MIVFLQKDNKDNVGKLQEVSDMSDDKIINSSTIQNELNEERKRKGLHELPPVNPINGGTSTLARKDKSWNSVPDFFRKLFKK
jgi:hypothetical protein